jgi:hypothetical protein
MTRGSAENRAAFDDAAILADAQARTGLSDFGPDPFREPMGVLLKSLREEAPLNELGRIVMRARVVESLETRLLTQEWIRRHPEILKEELGAPIVIMGLMRTGTTMLHRIVASDPRNHAANWWEVRFPAPRLDMDWSKPDPRIALAEAEVAAILEADPRQASIHPWDAQAPDEEIMLLEHSFFSHVPEAFVNIPSYRTFITQADWTPAYVYLKKQLQFLQWQKRQRGNVRERWILKTPGHLGYIDTLFKIFPGARAIFNHRDPVETVPSRRVDELRDVGALRRPVRGEDRGCPVAGAPRLGHFALDGVAQALLRRPLRRHLVQGRDEGPDPADRARLPDLRHRNDAGGAGGDAGLARSESPRQAPAPRVRALRVRAHARGHLRGVRRVPPTVHRVAEVGAARGTRPDDAPSVVRRRSARWRSAQRGTV